MKKLDNWRSTSAAFFYEKTADRIVSTHSFEYENLMPKPEGLLRHYRLKQLSDLSFADRISESAQRLVASEGLEIAIERLSKIPTLMPEKVIEQFKSLSDDNRHELLTKYSASWASPICKLHLFNLSIYSGDLDLARKLRDEMFSEKERSNFILFKRLLIWTSSEFERSNDVKDWQTSLKLAIIWIHSSYLYNIFHLGEADPQTLAEEFSEADSSLTANQIFNRTPIEWNDIAHPNRIDWSLILVGLGKIISTFDETIIKQLEIEEKYVKYANNEEEATGFLIFPDPLLMVNNLDSFFGGDRSVNLPFLSGDIAKQISSSNLKDIVKDSMNKIKSNEGSSIDWFKLSIILGDLPCYIDLQNELKKILLSIDFESTLAKDHLAAVLAVRLGSKQLRYFFDSDISVHIEDGLLRIASFFSNKPDLELGIFTINQVAVGLLDDALSLSIAAGNDKEISDKFYKLLQAIFERWPISAKNMQFGIFRLAQELPASFMHGLWKLMLFLRANSNR